MSTVVGQPTKQTYHILVCLLSAKSGRMVWKHKTKPSCVAVGEPYINKNPLNK